MLSLFKAVLKLKKASKHHSLVCWTSPNFRSICSSPGSLLHLCHVSLADGALRWFISDDVMLSEHLQCSFFILNPILVHPITHEIRHFCWFCRVMCNSCLKHFAAKFVCLCCEHAKENNNDNKEMHVPCVYIVFEN